MKILAVDTSSKNCSVSIVEFNEDIERKISKADKQNIINRF